MEMGIMKNSGSVANTGFYVTANFISTGRLSVLIYTKGNTAKYFVGESRMAVTNSVFNLGVTRALKVVG